MAELAITPSPAEARELAAGYDLVPLRHTEIDDCETPVSAFLKLRAASREGGAFLLESAAQGQHVGRYSFIGVRPRDVVRWSLGDDAANKLRLGNPVICRGRDAPVEAADAFATARGRLVAIGSVEAGMFKPRRVFVG